MFSGGANAEMSANLIKNPSLVEGGAQWNFQDPWHKAVENEGRTDKHSIYTQVIPGKTPYALCTQSVPLKGGKYYLFSAWIRTKGVSGKPVFCIEWASEGGYLGGSYINDWPIKLDGDNDWQHVTYASQRLPDEATGGNIVLSGAVGEMWWDDFALYEMGTPAFDVKFADPIWHGTTIVDGLKTSAIKFKLVKNPDVNLSVKSINVRASLYEVDNQPPVVSVELKGDDNGSEVVIPTDKMPLGTGTLRLEAVDSASGCTVFKDDLAINKIEWIGLDIVEPSVMGVVGDKQKLKCRVHCSVPPGAGKVSYDAQLQLVSTKGEPVGMTPIVKFKIASGEKKLVEYPMEKVPEGTYFLQTSISEKGASEKLAMSKRLVTRVDTKSRPGNAVDILPNGLLNTAIIQNAQGICFAVPINTARWVTGLLIRDGHITRVYLGIAAEQRPLHTRVIRYFKLEQNTAVGVVHVTPGGAAEEAGLQSGDTLIKLDDRPLKTPDDLFRQMSRIQAGQEITLSVLRYTEMIEIKAKPR